MTGAMGGDRSPGPMLDASLVRGLTERRVSRRGLLTGAAAAGAGLLLAGCGIRGTVGAAEPVNWAEFWRKQKRSNTLNFANWPLYIDQEHGRTKSLDMFEQKTGIHVKYQAVIQDNAPFYATVAPQLREHEATGYDIVVLTNGWFLTEMIRNGFLVQLDHSKLPNFAKYAAPAVKNPNYDPGNRYTAVWQTGFTGIAYNEKMIDRPITSFKDLLDPAFKGHVGMMNDNTELGSAGLLALGIDPAKSTVSDWKRAGEWLKKQRPLVSGYYDQSYIQHLENGDTWITQAWSGDVFQANASGYPHLKYVVPKEGQMIWHDNMMIPRQAEHPLAALEWMNFYYQPEIAAIVEDWVNYVCPVPAAQDYVAKVLKDKAVADSPLVFPSKALYAKSHNYALFRDYTDYQNWNDVFNPVIQS